MHCHVDHHNCSRVLAGFLTLLFLATTDVTPAVGEQPEATTRPNVLFILADDLGWRDLSNEGSTFYESPYIDRIANEGMKFTRGFATCQVCSPSRASIMTGKYPARLKITDWIGAAMGQKWKRNTKLLPAIYRHQLPLEDITIAEAFESAGYKTFFAGKWHLGDKGSLPEDHGFGTNIGGTHRGSPPGGYFSPYKNPKMTDGDKGELLPLRLGQETADWIEANQEKPFFAFLSFYSVHAPIQSTETLWKKYRDKAAAQPKPKNRFLIDRTTPVRQVQDNPLYAGMVESMDDGVGIVLERLEQLGLAKNTVIVFTSDNGGVSAGDGKATSNLPLRGGKGRQWEGGIREPFYIKWSDGQSGASDVLATGTDFYPTLLDICGLPSMPDQHVDGRSLVPALTSNGNQSSSEKLDALKDRTLYWHYPHYGNQGGEPSSIIRKGDWKLISYYEDNSMELYNVVNDIGEQTNVATDNPEITAQLRTDLDNWLRETEAAMPMNNPNYNPDAMAKAKVRIREKDLPNLERAGADLLKPDYKPAKGWWQETGK
ncbi:sulfatase [bacterium]|nr:sulfatase [bacterium]